MLYNLYVQSGKWFSYIPFQANLRRPGGMSKYNPWVRDDWRRDERRHFITPPYRNPSFSYVEEFYNQVKERTYIRTIEIMGVREKKKYSSNIFRFTITVNLDNELCKDDFVFHLEREGFIYKQATTPYSIPVSVDILSPYQLFQYLKFIHKFERLDETIGDAIRRAYIMFMAYENFVCLPPVPLEDGVQVQRQDHDSSEGSEHACNQLTLDFQNALKAGRVDDVKTLLYRGADPNAPIEDDTYRKISPLRLAITNATHNTPSNTDSGDWLSILTSLLEYRANPEVMEYTQYLYDTVLKFAISCGSSPIGMEALETVLWHIYSMGTAAPSSPEGISQEYLPAYERVRERYSFLYHSSQIKGSPPRISCIEIYSAEEYLQSLLPSLFMPDNKALFYTVVKTDKPISITVTKKCQDLGEKELEDLYSLSNMNFIYSKAEFDKKMSSKSDRLDIIDLIYINGTLAGFNRYSILLYYSICVLYVGLARSPSDRIPNYMSLISFRMAFVLHKILNNIDPIVLYHANAESFNQARQFEVEVNGVRVGPHPKYGEVSRSLMQFLIQLVYGPNHAPMISRIKDDREGEKMHLRQGDINFFNEMKGPVYVGFFTRNKKDQFTTIMNSALENFDLEEHLDKIVPIIEDHVINASHAKL